MSFDFKNFFTSKNFTFAAISSVGLTVFLISAWKIYSFYHSSSNISFSSPTTILPTATPTLDPDRQFSILLLGYGGAGHDGGALTDTIILANIIPHQQKIKLISLPRDLWVNVASDSTASFAKLNYAFVSQGGELTKKIIGEITGLTPEHYLAIDFTGFTKVIDILGGIDLKITQAFTDPFYPIEASASSTCDKPPEEVLALEATMSGEKLDQQFSCRYETLVFNIGTTHLDGATALKYARSRHSQQSGGDFNRSLRQKQIISAIKEKVLSLNFFTKIIPIYKTLTAHLRTDLSQSDIENYLLKATEYSHYRIDPLTLNDKNVLMISKSQNGQSILVPTGGQSNYQAIIDYLQAN